MEFDLLRRPELDEGADRHHVPSASRRARSSSAWMPRDVARDNARGYRPLSSAVVGTVFADQDAVGDKLHRRADGLRIGAEAAGDVAVDVEIPFDAGQRTRVFDVAQLRSCLSICVRIVVGDLGERRIVVRRDVDHHVLAGRRAVAAARALRHARRECWPSSARISSRISLPRAALAIVLQLDVDAGRYCRPARRPELLSVLLWPPDVA